MMAISDLPRTGQRFLTTFRFAKDPFTCYRRWKERYGDAFVVNALNGNVVVLCDKQDIRQLFSASFEEVAPFAIETVAPLVGRQSVFLLQGEAHRRERALLSPPFHGKCMLNKAQEIQQIAFEVADKLSIGKRFLVMDSSLDVSLEVIIQVVFGVQSAKLVETFKTATKELVKSFHPVLAFSRLLHRRLFGLSPWSRFVNQRDRYRQLLREQIEKRKREGGNEDSVLSQLIRSKYDDGGDVNIDSISDQLLSMLFAGHETTQIAIAWAMSWLHRHPKFAERLRADLDVDDSIDSILKNELLTGICNEALRINSVVSDTIRKLVSPMKFKHFELPTGTNIAIPICLVHEDPEVYPNPLTFNPDRWQNLKPKPHEFMPFGGGIRRCIGAPLAMMEMKLVVATWITNFEFELPSDAPKNESTHRRNVTMAPRSGIPLIYRGKRNRTQSA